MTDYGREITDVFGEFDERIEISRLEHLIMNKEVALLTATNEQVVALGKQATEAGLQHGGLVEAVWNTVTRHLELMKRAGSILVGPELPQDRKSSFSVKSQAVRISGDMNLVLCQRSSYASDSTEFWDSAKSLGPLAAVQQHAKPSTTKILLTNRKTHQNIHTVDLAPTSSSHHDVVFAEEWSRSMFPFTGPEFQERPNLHPDGTLVKLDTAYETTEKQLIIGAGHNARFNLMLDEVEANL